MIDWRAKFEEERCARIRAEVQRDRAVQLMEHTERMRELMLESRTEAWGDINKLSDRNRDLKEKLDDLAHRYGVLESERNRLACAVVDSAKLIMEGKAQDGR